MLPFIGRPRRPKSARSHRNTVSSQRVNVLIYERSAAAELILFALYSPNTVRCTTVEHSQECALSLQVVEENAFMCTIPATVPRTGPGQGARMCGSNSVDRTSRNRQGVHLLVLEELPFGGQPPAQLKGRGLWSAARGPQSSRAPATWLSSSVWSHVGVPAFPGGLTILYRSMDRLCLEGRSRKCNSVMSCHLRV